MENQVIVSEEEKVQIRKNYRTLLRACKNILSNEDVTEVRKAIEMSLERKKEHRRPSGKLSAIHSLEVANIVASEIGLGRTSIICALLYDVVQHEDVQKHEIKEVFGESVEAIVTGLIKVKELYTKDTSIETENFRKLLLSFAKDVRVILIILADRLETMRSLGLYSQSNQQKIAAEVGYLYAPMAHRLGLYSIKSEMEDMVMKYTMRDTYTFIAQKLNETKRARDKYIKDFIEPLKKELSEAGLKFEIKGRTKTIHSIHNKIKKQNTPFEKVYDLFAIRVILDSKEKDEKADCWKVYSIVTDKYQPNPSRLRDWLSIPKSNGYESLHTTVLGPEKKWVEVQIRTERMNEVAEKGLAAHWKYKGGKGEKGMDQWLSNIREVLENPELNAIDFIDDFKLNLYDEEVFVFTPKGDLRRLPKGATVLDFAFDIHSGVGKKCIGAKINGKHASIKQTLKNGDHIEIVTSNSQQPRKEWLKVVVTSRAKSKLKQAIKDLDYKEAEFGRETLVRRLKNWKIEINDQLVNQLVKHFKMKSINDFYREIGIGSIDVSSVKEYIQEQEKKEAGRDQAEVAQLKSATNFVANVDEEITASDDVLMIDKNLKNVDYTLAKCCNPIFGDEIFGFVAVSGGIKIHRMSCPNAPEMRSKFGYRIVNAKWTTGTGSSFQATLKVTGSDDIGIVSNISQVITKDMRLKMRSISIDSQEGSFEGSVTVFVNDTQVLDLLIKKIKNVKGVYAVSRIGSIA
ncbi:RelA/SpoT family protein [Plebeiibacterium marinum]|uniref:RelA/SpoT family protein n=1 Tax=Plebeiibacterium marinum TaxID=2992111 RepID=A0AAE3SLA3_9BACT|nr:RelA/SpoT family protein [Plebeiobacterium marinum]MCW3807234.1 RelA/SpoT family protein [Plebeiobacterium marinum]